MGEAKFTPGPWVAIYRGDYGGGAEGDVHLKEKWDVDPFDSGFMRGEFKWHDACLIAAAPELYEALEMAAKDLHTSAHFLPDTGLALLETVRIARSALAKARGEI